MGGGLAPALRRIVPALALLLGASAPLSHASEADIAPDVLDELESTICISASNWTNALEAHAKRQSIPVEALSGQAIADPARREYLQRRLDAVLTAAQQGPVGVRRPRFRALSRAATCCHLPSASERLHPY